MLDFIKDILNSFRQSSLERIKSPFLGAFVFSWLSFNWQLLAVLFSNEKDIFIKLKYINSNFGIESLMMGPIFTTCLICIILPTANKLVTAFQKKTNHETNAIILDSKIAIADKQLQLADIDAKKKLSEEREKKNIEADIESINDANRNLTINLETVNNQIKAVKEREAVSYQRGLELQEKLSFSEKKNSDMIIENNKLNDGLIRLRSENDKFALELQKTRGDLSKLSEEALKTSVVLKETTDEKFKLQGQLKALKEQLNETKEKIELLYVKGKDTVKNNDNRYYLFPQTDGTQESTKIHNNNLEKELKYVGKHTDYFTSDLQKNIIIQNKKD